MIESGKGVRELRLVVVEQGWVGHNDKGLLAPEDVEDGAGTCRGRDIGCEWWRTRGRRKAHIPAWLMIRSARS